MQTKADDDFEIFLVASPGAEETLCSEAKALNFAGAKLVPGGVTAHGAWPEVWRANLELRGCTRVLVRIGSFHAGHLGLCDVLRIPVILARRSSDRVLADRLSVRNHVEAIRCDRRKRPHRFQVLRSRRS